MKKHPIWYLIIGIGILVIPTAVYLGILIPQLKEEYTTLMASGGIIGAGGFYLTGKIPEDWKYGRLCKLASNSFTTLVIGVLIQEFYMKILGLIITFIASFIIYKILKGVWKNARRKKEQRELADEIKASINEDTK